MKSKLYPTIFACLLLFAAAPRLAAQCTVTIDAANPTLNCFTTAIDIVALASGGTPPYAFVWNTGQITAVVAAITPGNYCVTITDAQGCTATDCITITMSGNLPVAVATGGTLTCATTSLILNGAGSSVGPGYTYQWFGPATPANATTLNPIVTVPGVYTLVVTDVTNGCTAATDVVVTQDITAPNATTIASLPNLSCWAPTLTLSLAAQPGSTTYLWATADGNIVSGANTANPVVDAPGTYVVAVTNTANGCTSTASTVVTQGPPNLPAGDVTVTNPSCATGLPNGAITITPSIGQPPFTYIWTTATTGPALTNVGAGTYAVTATDATGCSGVLTFTLTAPPPIDVSIDEVVNACGSATLVASASGGTGALAFNWITGNTSATQIVSAGGLYGLTVTDASGCTGAASYLVQLSTSGPCATISGRVGQDDDENCALAAGEPGLSGWIVTATDGADTYYALSGADGSYSLGVPVGTYTLTTVAPPGLWQVCLGPFATGPLTAGASVTGLNLPVNAIDTCPLMTVDLSTPILRRCFSNNYYSVQYCNTGTAAATDAYVLLTLDPFLTPGTSSVPYTDLGNGVLRFDLGTVAVGQCGSFWVSVTVSCDAVLGQTHCTEAHIFPEGDCAPPNPLWSGASVDVTAECAGDSLYFTIRNVGTGPMTVPLEYIVIEDAVMLMLANTGPLAAGDSIVVAVEANGSTWHLEAGQEPLHPDYSAPGATVEGCSVASNFSLGFVNQFPANDAAPWIDIDCTENQGSYDPNDKQGFPTGYGPQHYIRPETEIEYLIRFQNTGTDTAFTVVILDTLAAWLDPATVRAGASSHAYSFDLYGNGVLSFTFPNILLPDSNVNEPLSHGFVKFSVKPKADAPLETVIENRAAIYFDFNEPVITNTVFHRLGEDFLVRTWQPERPGVSLKAFPNPMTDEARLAISGLPPTAMLTLQLFDTQGRLAQSTMAPAADLRLRRGTLAAGVYVFRLEYEGRTLGHGKIEVR